jgi:hypothetical protein
MLSPAERTQQRIAIRDLLPADIRAHVVNLDTFWSADEAASVFARAHTAVCHEPHSLIIPLANGLPEWLLEFDSTPAAKMTETLLRCTTTIPPRWRR